MTWRELSTALKARDAAQRDIGAAILSLRLDGVTWRDIAKRAGVSPRTVMRWYADYDARMRAEGWDV